MTFFDDFDLTDLAELVDEASPDTGIIHRLIGQSDDGHGGQIDVWDDIATVDIKVARSGQSTPTEQVIASQNVGKVLMEITMPAGTDIRHNDTVQVVRDGADDLYEVVGVPPVRSFEIRRRVTAVIVP